VPELRTATNVQTAEHRKSDGSICSVVFETNQKDSPGPKSFCSFDIALDMLQRSMEDRFGAAAERLGFVPGQGPNADTHTSSIKGSDAGPAGTCSSTARNQ
jgi:hypothetical protein